MARYIDSTYVDNAIGSTTRQNLTDYSSGTDDVLNQLIDAASALVDSVLKDLGYDTELSSPPEFVKRITLGALLPDLFGRKGLDVPEQLLSNVRLFEQVRQNRMSIPGLTPTARHAVGGVKFTPHDDDDDNPPVMDKLRKVF